jgi:hypothetical protein
MNSIAAVLALSSATAVVRDLGTKVLEEETRTYESVDTTWRIGIHSDAMRPELDGWND